MFQKQIKPGLFWDAVQAGDTDKFEKLLVARASIKDTPPNLNELSGDKACLQRGLRWGLLHKASSLGHHAIVSLLLDHGVSVNQYSEAQERDRDFG